MKITLSAKEAAKLLGVSYWLLLEMAKKHEVPHIRAGKRVLFRTESLEAWMDKQEQNSMNQSDKDNGVYGTLRKIEV